MKTDERHPLSELYWYDSINRRLVFEQIIEVTELMLNQLLEFFSPSLVGGGGFVSSEPHHINRDGEAVYLTGWYVDDKYYICLATVAQWRDREPIKRLSNLGFKQKIKKPESRLKRWLQNKFKLF